ncbi:hypothetical protein DLAC_04576 [Tieghemostelium lacteum]|uniref:Uncharacterized protein n=1 Tax=Tieghemostelium lacteum TaxID=361077 RepID=A0A151ZK21_TIELA|nr:hypothetical protein DLAC_04576 [Tieghemostelium lacteum]|eukprot:KYQ94277.1 hypothetical protein DLAC_04576 [Tieghemostelium lacteum]
MAQTNLKVKKTKNASPKKQSKVGLNKKKKSSNTAIDIAKQKVEKKIKSKIAQKIEGEMALKLKNNNGKLSILKIDTSKNGVTVPVVKDKKKK